MLGSGCGHGKNRGTGTVDRIFDQKARGDRNRKKATSGDRGIEAFPPSPPPPPDTLSDSDFRDREFPLPKEGITSDRVVVDKPKDWNA